MDVEKLINLVFDNKCLWDMTIKTYHNRDISRETWNKIAKEMNSNSEAVKSKWRGLRDTFRKELSKLTKKQSGSEGGAVKESTWPYFKYMEFLKDQFQKGKLEGNVPSSNEYYKDIEDPDVVSTPCSLDESGPRMHTRELLSPREASPEQHFVAPEKKKAKTKSAAIEKLLVIEEQKLKAYQQKYSSADNEDADFHFLMSLLPYLRKIPEQRKMFVRTKLQNVFCEEELQGGFRAQNTVSTDSSAHSSHSWPSDESRQVNITSQITHCHEDLASYFSSTLPE